ncbi:MAG TPA: MrpF/PhaF family protein [Pseudonocardiaceae bacterium]|jgi:multisubunit Na+/H+ antiporter MnhF subunit|nr:MrpF/PhaF family protein [Pseudonocardiaceae bacterium]
MTVWPLAAGVLMIGGLVPAMIIAYRDTAARRLVGLELVSATGTLVLLVLCQAFNQSSYLIVPLVLALLSFAGTLVFTRLLGAPHE